MLLQAFISQLKLEGFALMADMVYVTQVRVGCAALVCHGPLCCVHLGESRLILARGKDAELGLSWLAGCCVNGVDSLFCPS